MALNRKYSALPDLDTAPDVYETPELTDDNSTVLTTAGRSASDDDTDGDDDVETGISRSRVPVGQARSRFLGADVDARGVDFSDRVDGKRKSYRTAIRQRRSAEELGDLSDEDDGDSLERKIARLKREVEEAKEAYTRQAQDPQRAAAAASAAGLAAGAELDSLSQALGAMTRLADEDTRSLAAAVAATAPRPGPPPETLAAESLPARTLAQAADFDRRLLLLERSIGIGEAVMPELGLAGSGTAMPRAILPTLDALQRQLATLADASTASLDGISRRVRALTQEAEELVLARKAAKAAHEALVQAGVQAGAAPAAGAAADETKINALYGTLPTIESLAPLLPPLLDRLRSLRAIHADAAAASELLDALEQRQTETAAEVKQWREGLEKMEEAMRSSETTMTKNMQVMDTWVKELEDRLSKAA